MTKNQTKKNPKLVWQIIISSILNVGGLKHESNVSLCLSSYPTFEWSNPFYIIKDTISLWLNWITVWKVKAIFHSVSSGILSSWCALSGKQYKLNLIFVVLLLLVQQNDNKALIDWWIDWLKMAMVKSNQNKSTKIKMLAAASGNKNLRYNGWKRLYLLELFLVCNVTRAVFVQHNNSITRKIWCTFMFLTLESRIRSAALERLPSLWALLMLATLLPLQADAVPPE